MPFITSNLSSAGIYTEWLAVNPFGIAQVVIPSIGGLSGVVRLQMTLDGGSNVLDVEYYTISAIRTFPGEVWWDNGSLNGCQMRLGIVSASDYTAGSSVVQLWTV